MGSYYMFFDKDTNDLAQWESMISVLLFLFFYFLHISQNLVWNSSDIDNWVYESSTQREVWAIKIAGDLLHILSMKFIQVLIKTTGSFVTVCTRLLQIITMLCVCPCSRLFSYLTIVIEALCFLDLFDFPNVKIFNYKRNILFKIFLMMFIAER